MRENMIKFKLYLDKDEETRWLNAMAEQGWAVKRFFLGFYIFCRCKPGEYLYQIDFADQFGYLSQTYRDFMEEMGVEIVCQWGFWVILRRRVEEGPFELYSDVESAMNHYRKIRTMFKIVTAIEIMCFLVEIVVILEGAVNLLPLAMIIAAFILALVTEISRINDILAKLGERSGQPAEGSGWRRRRPSMFLPAGMLLNALALLLPRAGTFPWYNTVGRVLQIAAIVLMLLGIYRTARRR